MNLSTKDVLRDKKGIAEALGFTAIAMTVLLAAGAAVANYGIHSKQAGQLQTTTQEVQNRAEEFASDLNANLMSPEVPSMARECSTTTRTCTQILSVTPNTDGSRQVLRIQGDGATAFGQSITRDVTLVSAVETHVTAIDAAGNNVWANSGEGLQFKTWGVAGGKPSDVDPEDLLGPSTDNSWVQVAPRGGIDAKGRLWTWGTNRYGEAGIGHATSSVEDPRVISTEGQQFRSLITDDDRSYAIDSRGIGWGWGKSDGGMLGSGTDGNVTAPEQLGSRRWQKFALVDGSTYGLTMSGDLFVAGVPTITGSGLSYGTTAPNNGWRSVNAGTRYSDISAGLGGTLAAIEQTGTLKAWGSPSGFTSPSSVKFRSVSVADSVGFAISTDGVLYSWGRSTNGTLGQGSTTSASAPAVVSWSGLSGGAAPRVVSVSTGSSTTLAIGTDGQLYYVGAKPAGTSSALHTNASAFTKVMPGTTFRQAVNSTSSATSALLDADGNLYGDGTTSAGLWDTDYAGGTNQAVRMPAPSGFGSYTWRN